MVGVSCTVAVEHAPIGFHSARREPAPPPPHLPIALPMPGQRAVNRENPGRLRSLILRSSRAQPAWHPRHPNTRAPRRRRTRGGTLRCAVPVGFRQLSHRQLARPPLRPRPDRIESCRARPASAEGRIVSTLATCPRDRDHRRTPPPRSTIRYAFPFLRRRTVLRSIPRTRAASLTLPPTASHTRAM